MDDIATLGLQDLPGPVPAGANLLADGSGASFKTWAPTAREVRLRWDYVKGPDGAWHHRRENRLESLGVRGGEEAPVVGARRECRPRRFR